MSILNRLSLGGHLDDAALADIWTDAAGAAGVPSHPHLAECAPCRDRMDAFAAWMEQVRLEAVTEADEAFPAERLAAQQSQILRRLEATERPARIIAFPSFSRPLSTGTSHARRWIAAAAAAGLIVGVGVGQLMGVRHGVLGDTSSAELRVAEPPRPDRPAARIQPVSASMDERDADFMAGIEQSVSHNSLSELHALDAITPRAPLFDGGQR